MNMQKVATVVKSFVVGIVLSGAFGVMAIAGGKISAQCEDLKSCITQDAPCKDCSSGTLFPCGLNTIAVPNNSFLEESEEGFEDYSGLNVVPCYSVYTCTKTTTVCPTDPDEKTCTPNAFATTIYTYDNWISNNPC